MKALSVALMIAALPAAASAQAWSPPRAGAPAVDLNRYQADQHRLAMAQQRQQAEQRQAFAEQMQAEARLRRLEIEARRQPTPARAEPRARGGAEQRRAREAQAAGTGQIDSWLDGRSS